MPALDLVDDTWVAVPPARVAAAVHETARWARWWPDLLLEVTRDRGDKGVQWSVRSRPARPRRVALRPAGVPVVWAGTAEVWLEPWREGTVLHHYQRLDPVRPETLAGPVLDRFRDGRATAWKHHAHALKDELEERPGATGQVRAAARRSRRG